MVIEPPGNARRSRIFEVDNDVLVAAELLFMKQRARAVHQPMVFIAGVCPDALSMEARKKRGRAGTVETPVMVENTDPQSLKLLVVEGAMRTTQQSCSEFTR